MSDQTTRRFPRFLTQRSISNEVKATIAKLSADPQGTGRQRENMRLPDGRVMAHIANQTIGNIQDARNLFQVLPDMDYARQVLISATISPGDLTDTKILYSIKNDALDTNLTGPLLRKVQEFFDNSYRIRSLLHPILNDVMFETGSYPVLIMPESSIDRIINADNYSGVSMESAIQILDGHLQEETDNTGRYVPWGILGNPATDDKKNVDSYTGVSFESLTYSANNRYARDVDVSKIKISLESLAVDERSREAMTDLAKTFQNRIVEQGSTIEVSDNLNILKRPMVIDTRRKIAVRRIYGGRLHQRASLESRAQNGDVNAQRNLAAIEKSLYSKRRYKHVPVQPVMTHLQTGQETFGHPLVIHLPSESVIPIHVPGNPAEHIGYYVLLDIDGNPISVADQTTYYDDIRSQMNSADGYSSQILAQARRGMEGMGGINNEIIDEMSRIHSEAVEVDLLSRLRSGALSGNYQLGKTENINRIMLARHLKGQRTTMLFVPAELMSYIAFDYNEFGVGKSVLEDGKILGSIRAALMLANTLATINNAVGGKTIEIELDPEDENPVETVEFMLAEHAKVNSQGFSRIVGSTHPLGLADQIQNHGVNVVVTGNTRYPETKFNVGQRDGTSKPVDTELEEMMRKRHIQMFGLSPELMEGINQTDFATTVVQNNLMLLKRVIQNQEKLEPFLTEIVRRYVLNSGVFLTEMREVIRANVKFLPDEIAKDAKLSDEEKVDTFIYEFIEALFVELPSPEVGDIKKSTEAFEAYSEALDKVIDAYMSEEMFATDTGIGMEEVLPNVKAVVKAEFQRRWLRNNNIMPELDVFNTVSEEEGAPAFDLLEAAGNHLDGLNNALSDYIKKVLKAAKRRAKAAEKIAQSKQALEEAKGGSEGMGGEGGELESGDLEGGDDLSGLDNPEGETDALDTGSDEVEGLDDVPAETEVEESETDVTEDSTDSEIVTDEEDTFDVASVDDETPTDDTQTAEADVPETPDAEPEVEEPAATEEPEVPTEEEQADEPETAEVPEVEEESEEVTIPEVEESTDTPTEELDVEEEPETQEEEDVTPPEPDTEPSEQEQEEEEQEEVDTDEIEKDAEKQKKEAEEAEDDLELPDIEPPKLK